jgi:abhydrolase domain-containing protein 12
VTVGVWHILPVASIPEAGAEREEAWWDAALGDGRPVVLYLHGNTAHRAQSNRKELYQVLRRLDYHVVTFDYRGYADSTSPVAPTETGVVSDARAVYAWVAARVAGPLLVWGHSLGTAVSSHLVADLCTQEERPCGLVLESPFNNIFDEVRNHPMGWLWRKMPWFDWFFTAPLATNDLGFVSDQRLEAIDVPVMILHAEDDLVVPYKLGRALYEGAVERRDPTWPEVQWHGFKAELGYGHKFICRAPELPGIVRNFESQCRDKLAGEEGGDQDEEHET